MVKAPGGRRHAVSRRRADRAQRPDDISESAGTPAAEVEPFSSIEPAGHGHRLEMAASGALEEPLLLADRASGIVGPEVEPGAIARAREQDSGDARRLRELVEENFDFIWRCLRRLGLGSADAEDAAQQVFCVAARKLGLLQQGRERAFLFGTALRVASDFRRAAARRREAALDDIREPEDPGLDPHRTFERERARRDLDTILSAMPLEPRTVFVLFELEEMSTPEIAALLEVPVGTVASRLRRARELFRDAVKRLHARASFPGGWK